MDKSNGSIKTFKVVEDKPELNKQRETREIMEILNTTTWNKI